MNARRVLLGSLLLTAACNDTTLRTVEPRVEVGPRLLDLGTVWIGEAREDWAQVDLVFGPPARVLRVDVVQQGGEAFDATFDPEARATRSVPMAIPITFTPTEVGWYVARLTVVTDAKEGTHVVDVRGRAVEPELLARPGRIDFGRVRSGERPLERVELLNVGDRTLTLDRWTVDDPAFSVAQGLPVTLAPGQRGRIEVRAAPGDDLARLGILTLSISDAAHATQLFLAVNDCEGGAPDLHDRDGDGFTWCGGDCDDDDPTIHPGAVEIPDHIDQDCDGKPDNGTFLADDDGDGFCEGIADACSDGSLPGDCADHDPAISPAATEIPGNGVDDDCDGVVDDGGVDRDGDGFAEAGGDCDDDDPTRHPGARELPNGVDDDCDGLIDEGTRAYDDDGDGFCEGPGCTDGSIPGDCDDADPLAHPGARERPNGKDDDCNGVVDEGTDRYDDDRDGFTERGGDCDDTNPLINPARGNCPRVP